jgi:choline dehydrogenase-like flavoprotein
MRRSFVLWQKTSGWAFTKTKKIDEGRMQTDSVLYDYVIVGAGPAGCLLANRLSHNPSHRVLLLEAGGQDNYPWIHVPVGYLYCIGNPRTDWCFKTESEPGLNGRQGTGRLFLDQRHDLHARPVTRLR